MLAPLTYQQPAKINLSAMPVQSPALSRMFAAAVVNQQFCEMLLNNPREALRKGYLGETFALTQTESELVMSIRAKSLSDLARQVNRSLNAYY
jgi:hypothetical protein